MVGGMPRAGSRMYFFLIEELMFAAGHPNSVELREKLGENLPPRTINHYFQLPQLLAFNRVAQDTNTLFAIRTHKGLTLTGRALMNTGRMRGAYVYRDPRDVIVSALERGRIMRESGNAARYFGIGPYRTFARLKTLKGGLRWFKYQQFDRWKRWSNCPNILMSRYEDNISDPKKTLISLREHFKLDVPDEKLDAIAAPFFKPEEAVEKADYYTIKDTPGGGALKNKGVVGRFNETFSNEEIELINDYLGDIIQRMGYEL